MHIHLMSYQLKYVIKHMREINHLSNIYAEYTPNEEAIGSMMVWYFKYIKG
jgi:hypothetical protein